MKTRIEYIIALVAALVLLTGCGPETTDMCNLEVARVFNVNSDVNVTTCEDIDRQVKKALLLYALKEPELTNTDEPRITINLFAPDGEGDCFGRNGSADSTYVFGGGRGGVIGLFLGTNTRTGQVCTVRNSALAHAVLHTVDRNAIDRTESGHGTAPHDSLTWHEHDWFQLVEAARINP